jgi:hypothetical protein
MAIRLSSILFRTIILEKSKKMISQRIFRGLQHRNCCTFVLQSHYYHVEQKEHYHKGKW